MQNTIFIAIFMFAGNVLHAARSEMSKHEILIKVEPADLLAAIDNPQSPFAQIEVVRYDGEQAPEDFTIVGTIGSIASTADKQHLKQIIASPEAYVFVPDYRIEPMNDEFQPVSALLINVSNGDKRTINKLYDFGTRILKEKVKARSKL